MMLFTLHAALLYFVKGVFLMCVEIILIKIVKGLEDVNEVIHWFL